MESRIKLTPEEFDQWMAAREANFGKCPYTPTVSDWTINSMQGSIDHLYEGTYYLTKIDEKYRRFYAIKGESTPSLQSSLTSQSDSQAVQRLNSMKMQLLASK